MQSISKLAVLHAGHEHARVALRILTNLNLDRGRRIQRTPDLQPLEESDYSSRTSPPPRAAKYLEQDQVVARLSQQCRCALTSRRSSGRRRLVDIGVSSYADGADPRHPDRNGDVLLHRGRRALEAAHGRGDNGMTETAA